MTRLPFAAWLRHDLFRYFAASLLALGADNPIPWYGQLMTTPQTIAWFVQLNYWLEKYKVELV